MTALININDVVEEIGLAKSVKEAKYNQFIIASQVKNLTSLIGEACVTALETAVCTNTLDEYQEALMELVRPYLINYSYANYINQSMLYSSTSGIVKLDGDNSQAISEKEKKSSIDFYSSVANAWGDRIVTLLESDKVNYACFHDAGLCSCCNNEKKIGRSIFAG